jgi:hypothetical protein
MKDQDPGIKLHPHPTFENKKAKLGHLPDLNLRWGFIGQSGSGKGVAMLDLLLRHYRGVFDRIYLYSKSSTIDKNWDPLKKYVEQELGVDQREEQTFFDEFDAQAIQQQMDLQMKVAEEAKKMRMKAIPQVLWIIDDLADDPHVLHNNSNLIATLAIRSRHFGGNLWVSTQRFRSLATIIRINLTALFIWPAFNRLERKAIIEEIAGHYSEKEIEELLQHVSKRKYGFLFVNLKVSDPSEMFQDSLVQKLRITNGNALDDVAQ